MSDELDALFGEAGSGPEPRTTRVIAVLVVGLLLTFVGMLFTAAPGGLVVLLGWSMAEQELDRVRSGYLPADVAPHVERVHRAAVISVGVVLVAFVMQALLFCGTGVYEQLWTWMLATLAGTAL